MDIYKVISEIECFEPNSGNWLGLDDLVQELFLSGHPELGIDALVGVLEKYPQEDGAGVFWGILHGLESLPGYQDKIVASVTRKRSAMTLTMVNRMPSSGQEKVQGISLLSSLEDVAANRSHLQSSLYLIGRSVEGRRETSRRCSSCSAFPCACLNCAHSNLHTWSGVMGGWHSDARLRGREEVWPLPKDVREAN
jgi:hypothetical protein